MKLIFCNFLAQLSAFRFGWPVGNSVYFISVLPLSSLKMHGKFKVDQHLVKKVKHFHRYLPAAISKIFSTKFELEAKVQNSTFWYMSNLSFSDNSVALNINLNCQISFQGPRFFVKEICLLRKCRTKYLRNSVKYSV